MNSLAAPVLRASCIGPSPQKTRLRMTLLWIAAKTKEL